MALRVKEISAGIGTGWDRSSVVFDGFYVVVSFEGIYIYTIARGIDLNLAMMNLVFLPCHIINILKVPHK